jgi:hypothetical protein
MSPPGGWVNAPPIEREKMKIRTVSGSMYLAASQDFYTVSAQVLPVFMIVIAVGEARIETRKFSIRRVPEILVAVFVIALFVLIGELAALKVMVWGHDTRALHNLTAAGLSFGAAYLMMKLLTVGIEEADLEEPDRLKRQLRWVAVSGLSVVLVSIAFLGEGSTGMFGF